MNKIIFAALMFLSFCTESFAQGLTTTSPAPLMPNQIGFGSIYTSDSNGNRSENAIGGLYLVNYSARVGKIPFTIFNVGSVETDSATPVGGRQFTEELELRVPLSDLKVPFMGDNSMVFLQGGSTFVWQAGANTRSRFVASPGFGVGFHVPAPFGGTYTTYTYVPNINSSNFNVQAHRVGFEVYKPFGDNANYNFFTRTTASTGRFNPLPMNPSFVSGDPAGYYNVRIAVGISRKY